MPPDATRCPLKLTLPVAAFAAAAWLSVMHVTGARNLECMSWAWLTETPALLIAFIAAVIGIPASVIAITPVVRRTDRSRAKGSALKPSTALVTVDGTCMDAAILRYCRKCEQEKGVSRQSVSPALKATYKRAVQEHYRHHRPRSEGS